MKAHSSAEDEGPPSSFLMNRSQGRCRRALPLNCDIKGNIPERTFKVMGKKANQEKLEVKSRAWKPFEGRPDHQFRRDKK